MTSCSCLQILHFYDLSDERASAIPGKWSDGNGNTYTFKDDNTMVIDDSETETKGTYSVAENSEGTCLLKIVVEGGALEFEYNLNADGTEMDLQSPGQRQSITDKRVK